MINQKKRNIFKLYICCALIPFFALPLLSFNTKTLPLPSKAFINEHLVDIIELKIDKNTSELQLTKIKTDLAKKNYDFTYTVVRNKNGEIKNLSIEIKGSDKKMGEVKSRYNSASDNDTIDPTYIFIDTSKNSVLIRNSEMNVDVSKIKKLKSDKNKQVAISTSSTSDYDIKISEQEGNSFMFVDNDKEEAPLIFIDGNKSDEAAVKNLKESSIASMNVLKGESAIKKYGKEAQNGVVEITTKK